MANYQWKLVKRISPNCRLFVSEGFRDKKNNLRYALADNSDDTPDLCDFGVVWIDRTRDIMVLGNRITIPVLDNNGRPYTQPSTFDVAMFLSNLLSWPVKVGNQGRFEIIMRELR